MMNVSYRPSAYHNTEYNAPVTFLQLRKSINLLMLFLSELNRVFEFLNLFDFNGFDRM